MDETQQSRVSDAAATRKRRSSILKSQRPPRTPFSELEFNVATPTDTAKSRRVSFSRRTGVAEFITNEATTTWKNFYEEHNKSLESSGNESGAHGSRQPVGHIGKRVFDQQFEEVEAIDFNINPGININTSYNNFEQQLASLEHTGNTKPTAPQNRFEVSLLTNQTKLFGDDIAVTSNCEVSERIDVNFSAVQMIGNDDLDEIQKDFAQNGNVICHGPFRDRQNISEYIEIDLNSTHVTVANVQDKVQDESKSTSIDKKVLTKDLVVDKENIAINPYVAPKESLNFAINEEADKVLVFDGKRLTLQSDKKIDMKPPERVPRKTIVLNVNDDLPNFVDDLHSNASGYISVADLKHNTMMDSDMSITKPLDDSRIQTLNQQSKEKRRTIVYESETGNISITQAVPTNIIANADKQKTFLFEDNTGDISMTQAIPNNVIIPEKRRTIVYDNDDGNISMTQALPANIIAANKEMDKSRRTVVYEEDTGNLSIKQTVPRATDKRRTIVYEDDTINISVTRAVPTNLIIENKNPVERRRTVVYESDSGNISVTQAVPSNVILSSHQNRETIQDISMTQAVPTNIITNNMNYTNLLEDSVQNLSITQAVPAKIITAANVLLENTKHDNKRRTIVFEDDAGDISMTQAVPANFIANIPEPKRRTIIFENDTGNISITQVIPDQVIKCLETTISSNKENGGIPKANEMTGSRVFNNVDARDTNKLNSIATKVNNKDVSMTKMLINSLLDGVDSEEYVDGTKLISDTHNEVRVNQTIPDVVKPVEVMNVETKKQAIKDLNISSTNTSAKAKENGVKGIIHIQTPNLLLNESIERVLIDNIMPTDKSKPIPSDLAYIQDEILLKDMPKKNPNFNGEPNIDQVLVYQMSHKTDSKSHPINEVTKDELLKEVNKSHTEVDSVHSEAKVIEDTEHLIEGSQNIEPVLLKNIDALETREFTPELVKNQEIGSVASKELKSDTVTEEKLSPEPSNLDVKPELIESKESSDSVKNEVVKPDLIQSQESNKDADLKTELVDDQNINENTDLKLDSESPEINTEANENLKLKIALLESQRSNPLVDLDLDSNPSGANKELDTDNDCNTNENPKLEGTESKQSGLKPTDSQTSASYQIHDIVYNMPEKQIDDKKESINKENTSKSSVKMPSKHNSLLNNLLDMSNASLVTAEHSIVEKIKAPKSSEVRIGEDKSNDMFVIIQDSDSEPNKDIESNKQDKHDTTKSPPAEENHTSPKHKTSIIKELKNKLKKLKKDVDFSKKSPKSKSHDATHAEDKNKSKVNENTTKNKSFKTANDTNELLDLISDFTEKTAAVPRVSSRSSRSTTLSASSTSKDKAEPVLKGILAADNKSDAKKSDTQSERRTSTIPKRLSFVISRDDILNNISLAGQALQKSRLELSSDSFTDTTRGSTPPSMSVQNLSPKKTVRMSNEVVKTLQFDDDVSEINNTSSDYKTSPLKKTVFGETSYMQPIKGNVIPSYLSDVSDDIKELMNDLVKPNADGVPFESHGIRRVKRNTSTSSMQIQANIITSSQISMQTQAINSSQIDLADRPLKSALKPAHDYSNDVDKVAKPYTENTDEVLLFDHYNPLNNVLLPPPEIRDIHKYNPIHLNDSMNTSMTSNSAKETPVETDDSKSKVLSHQAVSDKKSSGEEGDANQSIGLKEIVSFDKCVDTKLNELKSTQVNTVIVMKEYKELLQANSSLTLVDDAAKSSDKDSLPMDGELSPVRVIYPIEDTEIEMDQTESVQSSPEKRKKRTHSQFKSNKKNKSHLNTPPKPANKIQKLSNSPVRGRMVAEKDSHCNRATSPQSLRHRDTKPGLNVTVQQLMTQYNVEPGRQFHEEIKRAVLTTPTKGSKSVATSSSQDTLSSFTSSKHLGRIDSSRTSSKASKMDWQPFYNDESSTPSECDSSVNVVAKINMMPFMGSQDCEWESSNLDMWTFRLLHSRIRLVVRLAHRHDNLTRTCVRADTPVVLVALDPLPVESENPLGALCVRVACAGMRGAGAACGAAGGVPGLLRRCAGVARLVTRWARAMHDARHRLAYTLTQDGVLTLKVANIALRSVWEVTIQIEMVSEGVGLTPAPLARHLKVTSVVADTHIDYRELNDRIKDVPHDWGHVPRVIWRVFKYLKNMTRNDQVLGYKL